MLARRHRVGFGVGMVLAGMLSVSSGSGQTYANFSDFAVAEAATSAGLWAPDPPAACWPDWHKKHGWHWFMDWDDKAPDHHKDWDNDDWDDKSYSTKKSFGRWGLGGPTAEGLAPFHGRSWPRMQIIYGTVGDDVPLEGGNGPQIIMGLAGSDVINGGNSLDCLVGGPGDDILNGANSTDILIGGPGTDQLNGGNGIDILIGDAGADQLNGGNGPDIILAGKNDEVVNRQKWDIVIWIDELDDCDGSGNLGGFLECLLPNIFTFEDAMRLMFFELADLEETDGDPKRERSLLAPEPASADSETTDESDPTADETPAEVEESEPGPAAEDLQSDQEVSTPVEAPPTEDSKDETSEPSSTDTDATTDGDSTQPGSATACDGSQPDDPNCEVKP
ncbi:MAG: hypothetical protein ACOYX5_04715 [Actinomycetota bacterium]